LTFRKGEIVPMADFCLTCLARGVCESICPELKLHLREIEVKQKELPIRFPRRGRVEWAPPPTKLTKREREIVTLFGKGLSRSETCELLKITKKTLRNNLAKIKKKHEK